MDECAVTAAARADPLHNKEPNRSVFPPQLRTKRIPCQFCLERFNFGGMCGQ